MRVTRTERGKAGLERRFKAMLQPAFWRPNRRLLHAPAEGTAQALDKRRAGWGRRSGGGGGVGRLRRGPQMRSILTRGRKPLAWRGAVRRVRSVASGGIAVVRRHDAGLESRSRRA